MNTTEPQVTVLAFAPIETVPELHNVLVCWKRRGLSPRMAYRDGEDWYCAVTGRHFKLKPTGWLDPEPLESFNSQECSRRVQLNQVLDSVPDSTDEPLAVQIKKWTHERYALRQENEALMNENDEIISMINHGKICHS